MWVRGHSRSLKMVSFESLGTVSYSPSIVTMAVSVVVCEIVSVSVGFDLENRVRVRSRSLEMALFDRSHTSLAFNSNYGSILYRLRDITTYRSKIAKFLYPTCIYSASERGDPVGISRRCLMLIKLE